MTVNRTTITINERTFEYFKSINVIDNIESFGKVFSIELNVPNSDDFEILVNDIVFIEVDGERLMTGFVESFECNITPTQRIFRILGRDIVVDFTDSTLPDYVFKTPFTIESALKKLLIANGFDVVTKNNLLAPQGVGKIAIINDFGNIAPFTETESDQYIKPLEEKSFKLISRLANMRGILIGTDERGNIVIKQVGSELATTNLICIKSDGNNNINNIKEARVITNFQDRFNKYQYISSSSNGDAGSSIFKSDKPEQKSISNDLVRKVATVYDDEVRSNRIFTKYRAGLSQKQCKDYATWELNVRKAKSKILSYKVLGFRQNLSENLAENKLWKSNQIVYVLDESQYPIIDDSYLIKSVNYIQDSGSGTICELELVDRLAYSYAIRDPLIKRARGKGDLGRIFTDLPEDIAIRNRKVL